MSKELYDMPLQPSTKLKTTVPNTPIPIHDSNKTPINTMHTHQQLLYTEHRDRNYDLPCQSTNDYMSISYIENRPVVIKNGYNHDSITNVNQKNSVNDERQIPITQKKTVVTAKTKVYSVYQKLLEESKKKDKQNHYNITQATFNPKQLKEQIVQINNSQPPKHQLLKQPKQPNQNKTRQSQQKKSKQSDNYKKSYLLNLNNTNTIKTKYQKILDQYFNHKFQDKKKQEYLSIEDIRLGKIYGKNSNILKLKSKLSIPILPINSNLQQNKNNTQQCANNYQIKITQKSCRIFPSKNEQQIKLQTKKTKSNKNIQKIKIQQHNHNSSQSYKNLQTQRWMSMNFYERQQRILSNRKQKQVLGKKKNIEKQIKSCTFKPQIINKSKSAKTLPNQKLSYLQLYYDKLHRKY